MEILDMSLLRPLDRYFVREVELCRKRHIKLLFCDMFDLRRSWIVAKVRQNDIGHIRCIWKYLTCLYFGLWIDISFSMFSL